MNTTTKAKLFRRDFTLVAIGQIVSLFGNAILRFALPLYLLRQTGSAALFGLVSACSFLPMIALSFLGGCWPTGSTSATSWWRWTFSPPCW